MKKYHRPVTLLAVTLALVGLLGAVLGACGSGQKDDGGGAQVEFTTYTDKTYGFSFQYPKDWKVEENASFGATAGAGAKAAMGVFDPKGAKAGGEYIDMLLAAVYELNVTIDESMMGDVKAELENLLAQIEAQSPDAKVQGDLTETTVNGMPGFMATYTFDKNGEPATSTLYFLFDGPIEYQVTVQAASKNWQTLKPLFDTMVASFKAGTSR